MTVFSAHVRLQEVAVVVNGSIDLGNIVYSLTKLAWLTKAICGSSLGAITVLMNADSATCYDMVVSIEHHALKEQRVLRLLAHAMRWTHCAASLG